MLNGTIMRMLSAFAALCLIPPILWADAYMSPTQGAGPADPANAPLKAGVTACIGQNVSPTPMDGIN